eukprot:Rhum_TRINITY_DN14152_c7_g1::Rhum_TRINITY_DN14152_c7_g1_i1::g.70332::m.70332/K03320/amt, AMT, MEP; ammonium transporter, Amt family
MYANITAELAANTAAEAELQNALDKMWTLVACLFVFLMQVGFAFLEAGSVRAVNVIAITFKNLGDCSIGALLWFLMGSQVASAPKEGQPLYGVVGKLGWHDADVEASNLLMFLYLATAATIVSGALAERVTILAYFVITGYISAFHYPIVVHWMWSDDGNGHQGFLRSFGAIDFAGSLVVHTNGGCMAFVAAWLLGPRRLPGDVSPFTPEGKSIIAPHDKFLQAAGVMFLWVGWLGFNAGSVQSFTKDVLLAETAAVSTVIAGSVGAFCGMAVTRVWYQHLDLSQVCNSLLGSLVAITASCAFVTPSVAALIGVLGSATYFASQKLVRSLGVDDVVDASSVHGSCGILGTLCVALADESLLRLVLRKPDFTLHRGELLAKQVCAVLAVVAWCSAMALVVCCTLRRLGILRVSAEAELVGCDGHFFNCYGYDYIGDVVQEMNCGMTAKDNVSDSVTEEGDGIQLLGLDMRSGTGSAGDRKRFRFLNVGNMMNELKSQSRRVDTSSSLPSLCYNDDPTQTSGGPHPTLGHHPPPSSGSAGRRASLSSELFTHRVTTVHPLVRPVAPSYDERPTPARTGSPTAADAAAAAAAACGTVAVDVHDGGLGAAGLGYADDALHTNHAVGSDWDDRYVPSTLVSLTGDMSPVVSPSPPGLSSGVPEASGGGAATRGRASSAVAAAWPEYAAPPSRADSVASVASVASAAALNSEATRCSAGIHTAPVYPSDTHYNVFGGFRGFGCAGGGAVGSTLGRTLSDGGRPSPPALEAEEEAATTAAVVAPSPVSLPRSAAAPEGFWGVASAGAEAAGERAAPEAAPVVAELSAPPGNCGDDGTGGGGGECQEQGPVAKPTAVREATTNPATCLKCGHNGWTAIRARTKGTRKVTTLACVECSDRRNFNIQEHGACQDFKGGRCHDTACTSLHLCRAKKANKQA